MGGLGLVVVHTGADKWIFVLILHTLACVFMLWQERIEIASNNFIFVAA